MTKNFDAIHLMGEIQVLKGQVKHLQEIIKFHGLNHIPLKYKKMFPKHNESDFFELDGFKEWKPAVFHLTMNEDHVQEVILPKDIKEIGKAKERMRKYAEESRRRSLGESPAASLKRDDTL
jgi:hypothetical protein